MIRPTEPRPHDGTLRRLETINQIVCTMRNIGYIISEAKSGSAENRSQKLELKTWLQQGSWPITCVGGLASPKKGIRDAIQPEPDVLLRA
jgi:hypothetical protein